MVSASDYDGLKRGLGEFGDGVDHDGCFLYDSEHARNEHQMLLADIESTEVGQALSEGAFVVLKDSLIG